MTAGRITARNEVVSLRAPAMACEFVVQFPSSQSDRRFAMDAFDWLERLEEQLSVYRESSELSTLNRTAFDGPVSVSPALYALLKRCRVWWKESERALDVTAGPLIKAWGFFQREGRVPTDAELANARARTGMDHVRLGEARRTIQYLRPGMEINLGAVGKGYALDHIASRLRRVGYRELLLGAGASSILAVGNPLWDDAWTVDVRHPRDRSRPIALVGLKDAALSTSGVSEQSFADGGRRLGHILDPRSGRPVEGMLQATALAGDAAEAEALSTAFFINGLEWTGSYCQRRPDIGALLIQDSPPDRDLQMILLGRLRDVAVLPEASS